MQKSLYYTKWAAHCGDAQAINNLGHLIINGIGAAKDEAKAVRLFKQSALLGAAEGQLNWGLALLRGNGGAKIDYQAAVHWAEKSAAQGHQLAQQQLPMFYSAARNPNPPLRSLPETKAELLRLSVKELRGLLHAEGVDFSDCVEKGELITRAEQHLLAGVAEPWDPAPEHPLVLEASRKLLLQEQRRRLQEQARQSQRTDDAQSPQVEAVAPEAAPAYGQAVPAASLRREEGHLAPAPAAAVAQSGGPSARGAATATAAGVAAAAPSPSPVVGTPLDDDYYEAVD
eukprot:TRINITY_DN8723_c0_g2_i1.p1 TRINITY_DN8723_c0_g2~~TRINITY_DN8723_c0_g2_i1.p1  ORF type:complete len:286 (+),score=82.79 TRINITY_DN8723_c0_g2_i1:405-1262(+)